MGTNYYTRENECRHCDRYEEIHLGKSSCGWEFSFQYNGGEYYHNIKEMKQWLKDKNIFNEYGSKVSYKEFWKMVKDKKGGLKHAEKHPGVTDFMIEGYSFTDCEFC